MTAGNGLFRPRVLVVAEAANPELVSVPLVGWSHARALARVCNVHCVTQVRNHDAWLRAGVPESEFTAIDSEKVAAPLYKIADKLRGGGGKGWTTLMAFNMLSYRYFESLVWKKFKDRILAGQYDIVHRLTPLSPTIPSLLGMRCAAAGIPFVLGPLNGGVAWPKAFDAERRREREWLSYVRGVHRWVPGYSATRRAARAILCGSRDVVEQMPMWARDKCFYIPENAVDAARFNTTVDRGPATLPLKVTFVGRLVPYKGTDMLLAAAAPLIREGKVVVDVIGDGPEMESIKKLVDRERIASGVTFSGWIEHTKLQERFSRADVFGFPSVREFGGGVVLEAMMLGLAPVVVDYGGPGELVSPMTGIAVPLGSREEIVARVREALSRLATNPAMAREMGRLGRERALRHFTWSAKAEQVMRVYEWILGRRKAKPEMPMPIPDTTQAPADGGVESKEESGRMVRNT